MLTITPGADEALEAEEADVRRFLDQSSTAVIQ
jgi:hypothetical protein